MGPGGLRETVRGEQRLFGGGFYIGTFYRMFSLLVVLSGLF